MLNSLQAAVRQPFPLVLRFPLLPASCRRTENLNKHNFDLCITLAGMHDVAIRKSTDCSVPQLNRPSVFCQAQAIQK